MAIYWQIVCFPLLTGYGIQYLVNGIVLMVRLELAFPETESALLNYLPRSYSGVLYFPAVISSSNNARELI